MMPNFKTEDMVYESPWNKQLLEMNDAAFEAMAAQMAAGMSLNQEKQHQIKEWMIEADRETFIYGYTDFLKLDLREDIGEINIPVSILGAAQPYGLDRSRDTYAEQYKNLKNYDIDFAPDAAHFIMYDSPKWFQEKLYNSLGQ